jgi:sulfotransferase
MSQQYFFMAGMPRSGSTLLGAILMQNPDVYVSPQSCLPNAIGAMYNQYQSLENKDSDQFKNIFAAVDAMIPAFYSVNPQPYIIDKHFYWNAPHPWVILQHHLKNSVRVINPVRDVMDTLASFNRLCEEDPNNSYDREVREFDQRNVPMADKRAKFFMEREESGILSALQNMRGVYENGGAENSLFVEYESMLTNPSGTIEQVYKFLGIPEYQHDVSSISNPHEYTDAWGVKNHHKVKSQLQETVYDHPNIFSEETIAKYSHLNFWRDL